VNYENTLTGETYQATIGKTKGQNLTAEELLAAIDEKHGTALKNAYAEKKLTLVSVKNFGRDYDLSATLETNVYLDVAFNYSVDCGYVATDNGDGTATITGYDAETRLCGGRRIENGGDSRKRNRKRKEP